MSAPFFVCDGERSFEFAGRFAFHIPSTDAWERASVQMIRRGIHVFDGPVLLGTFFVDKETFTRIEAPMSFEVISFPDAAVGANLSCAAKIDLDELNHSARITIADTKGSGARFAIACALDVDDEDEDVDDEEEVDDDEDDDYASDDVSDDEEEEEEEEEDDEDEDDDDDGIRIAKKARKA